MRYGDLSNRRAPTIAVRVEGTIIKNMGIQHYEKTVLERLTDRLERWAGKETQWDIDDSFSRWIHAKFLKSDISVVLVINRENATEEVVELLNQMPITRVDVVDKYSEVMQRLVVGEYTYYVDDNPTFTLVGDKHIISLRQLLNGRVI